MRAGMHSLGCLVAVLMVTAVGSYAASVEHIAADEVRVTIGFDRSHFDFEKIDGYDYVRGPDMVYLPETAVPGLPMKPCHLVIPSDALVEGVEADCVEETQFDGAFRIVPTQPPAILGQGQPAWVAGRADIYTLDALYPYDLVGGVHQGFMGDNRILSFYVSPFRWNPVTGQLVLCREVLVTVHLGRNQVMRRIRRPGGEETVFTDMVRRVVLNPEDVTVSAGQSGPMPLLKASMLNGGTYEYVVVAEDSLAACFDPLIEWKTQKGVPATCVTREWIEATYPGSNTQEQVRDFITDAYETWGTVWVLLGGDTKSIPSRRVYAMDCEMGINGNKIRSDLYFADLDGTWNANGVEPYGEVADSVDMYPDLFVGRAPAENVAEAVVFVNKVLAYEKTPPADFALDMVMAGEIMWTNPYTDGGVGLDMIDADCVPPRYDPILKLYESLGNESPATVLAAMSAGQNFILHDGHCNESVMGTGTGYISYLDADALSNGDRTFILNSIGCYPAAIDLDCIAEHFMNNPNGGCVAFIGNCRYGWGSPGNPGFGYSDKFQYEFAKSVFVDDAVHIGEAHAESKAVFVEFARDENVYRWNEYQLNLLGCPEMPMWTDDPKVFTVSAPDSVMAAGDIARIVVEDASGAVEGALVCLMNGDDVYARGRTDASGSVELAVSTASPDSLLLTVTGYNHLCHQEMIDVVNQGVLLARTGVLILDGDDAKANPGEVTDMSVAVKNFGTAPDSGVWGLLRSPSELCTVTDSLVYYGYIGAGAEVTALSDFTVEFDSTLANGQAVVLELVVSDSTANQWVARLPIVVAAPVFEVASYGIDDRLGGDADWLVEPGETVLLTLEVENSGLTYGPATVNLSSLDPYFTAEDSVASAGTIASGSVGYTLHKVGVLSGCPATHVGMLEANITSMGRQIGVDTVYFSVGDLAFADDCESGEGTWSHTGSLDLWHLTTYRCHSDSSSWYFGSDDTHLYPSYGDADLKSQTFIAGEASKLSFWFWYDFTTYGTDGLYVIVETNGEADTLDFIGSGGALDGGDAGALNIVGSWTKWEKYPPGVNPGDTVVASFAFISDNTDVAEGIYLDDIAFGGKVPVLTGVDDRQPIALPVTLKAYPNPARSDVMIAFAPDRGMAVVAVYDVEGRLVKTLTKPAGANSVHWDLQDHNGSRVAPGIYLAEVRGQAYAYTTKVVVLR